MACPVPVQPSPEYMTLFVEPRFVTCRAGVVRSSLASMSFELVVGAAVVVVKGRRVVMARVRNGLRCIFLGGGDSWFCGLVSYHVCRGKLLGLLIRMREGMRSDEGLRLCELTGGGQHFDAGPNLFIPNSSRRPSPFLSLSLSLSQSQRRFGANRPSAADLRCVR
jgi:hypothetical protein